MSLSSDAQCALYTLLAFYVLGAVSCLGYYAKADPESVRRNVPEAFYSDGCLALLRPIVCGVIPSLLWPALLLALAALVFIVLCVQHCKRASEDLDRWAGFPVSGKGATRGGDGETGSRAEHTREPSASFEMDDIPRGPEAAYVNI